MKITIPYHPGLSDPYVNAKKMELLVEKSVLKALDGIRPQKDASLVCISFQVDVQIKTMIAGAVLMHCICKKFPLFEPTALFINRVPSPEMKVEIEFGKFTDIGGAFV